MAAPPIIDHPAAWRASELEQRPDWQLHLDLADLQELETARDATRDLPREALGESFELPKLGSKLRSVQDSLEHGSGATIIRGFDPSAYCEEDCRRIFWGICHHIGTPISQSATGERIFSVRDEGFREDDPRARGPNTRKKLSFHTDRCDVITFLCLQPAKSGGENEVVSSMTVYNEIARRRPDLLEVLLEPYHYKRHNVDTGNALPYCQQPIFSFQDGYFASAFLRVLIERAYAMEEVPDMTPLQREALDFVESVAAETELQVRFRQEAGDILLLNNWVTYHRRTEFQDHEDPALRRHILRVWLSVPNSRPLAPWFLDNYGAIEAGAIRGGMREA